jgi:hypothetical protein
MTRARTLSKPRLFASSPWLASAVAIVSLGALPAAAQSQLWIRQIGTGTDEQAQAATPDGSGGVYLGGITGGNLGGPSAGISDAWLARYDNAGTQTWIRQLGTIDYDTAYATAPDGAGGVYLSGGTGGNLGGSNAGYDAWLARYDSAGNQFWILQFGSGAGDWAYSAAPDGSGGVYVGGSTSGSLGGSNAGAYDVWLARFDPAGNTLWLLQLGTSGSEGFFAAAPDGSGGVYLGGYTNGSLGGSSMGGNDALLARYGPGGNQLWVRQLGTSNHDNVIAAAPDGTGGVYVSGKTQGSLGGPNAGSEDAWLARYDSLGNQLWVRQLGTGNVDSVRTASPDGSGGVYVGGFTLGSFGGPSAGMDDAWLARYDGVGNQLWIHQLGTGGLDAAHAVAGDASGGFYLVGFTSGSLGGLNAGGWDVWLARYDSCGGHSSYCTSKVNSAGCTPSINFTGAPSATAGSGFTVGATNILNSKFGLFFYSKSGQQAVPFQGGFLCAKVPLIRTALQNSGGVAPCGGTFNMDFNTYIASGKDPTLVPGTTVDGQYWSRDPGFAPPNNTSLSDAVSFTICP